MAQLMGVDLVSVELQGASFLSTKLNLALLLNLKRGEFTQELYERLEKQLSENQENKEVRIGLSRARSRIGKADELVRAATHHALCEETDLQNECLPLEHSEQFIQEWVDFMISLACPDVFISEGVAHLAMMHITSSADNIEINKLRRNKAHMLVKRLLSPDCKGGTELPDNLQKRLQRIVEAGALTGIDTK
jgi:hypothetical protein